MYENAGQAIILSTVAMPPVKIRKGRILFQLPIHCFTDYVSIQNGSSSGQTEWVLTSQNAHISPHMTITQMTHGGCGN
jgi:hypothetical protein